MRVALRTLRGAIAAMLVANSSVPLAIRNANAGPPKATSRAKAKPKRSATAFAPQRVSAVYSAMVRAWHAAATEPASVGSYGREKLRLVSINRGERVELDP